MMAAKNVAAKKEKGSVSIDAQNIMPVIKRWLYSDKDIFLREAVSNACDAITKFRMLHPDSEEPMTVTVNVNKDKKLITISDTGIGMTAEEVRKYINQVAFSGAAEFMKQFENEKPDEKNDIIGHFGLGFYSVFMVSDKVEIQTLSSEGEAEPVHWVSKDGMGYELSAGRRKAHGTDNNYSHLILLCKNKSRLIRRRKSGKNAISVRKIQKSCQMQQLPFLLQLFDIGENRSEISASPPPDFQLLCKAEDIPAVSKYGVLLHGGIALDHMDIYCFCKDFSFAEDIVCFCQEFSDKFVIAGSGSVYRDRKLTDRFYLLIFEGLYQRNISIERQPIGIVNVVKFIRTRPHPLLKHCKFLQESFIAVILPGHSRKSLQKAAGILAHGRTVL